MRSWPEPGPGGEPPRPVEMAGSFSTERLPPHQQFEAWRTRVGPVVDLAPLEDARAGCVATHSLWSLGAMAYSAVKAPALGFSRPAAAIRRDWIDHWMLLSVSGGSATFRVDDRVVVARPGAPVLLPFGRPHAGRRTEGNWRALFLPRDAFPRLSERLDLAPVHVVKAPYGHLLEDFMAWLDSALPTFGADDAATLPHAVSALLALSLGAAPNADDRGGETDLRDCIALARRERVNRLIRANLNRHALGPRMLCREAGMSRSTLYRLFGDCGGVAATIQRERLRAARTALSDPSDGRSIREIAEALAFSDASTFSRAFRGAFGLSPREARLAALAGAAPGRCSPAGSHGETDSFCTFLRRI